MLVFPPGIGGFGYLVDVRSVIGHSVERWRTEKMRLVRPMLWTFARFKLTRHT
jgi:hypothetical protein